MKYLSIMLTDSMYKNVMDHKLDPSVPVQIVESIRHGKENRWIPVSEKLPKPNRLVLCHITTGTTETYFLALWNDILNAWEEGIGGYRLLENDLGYEVIEWMPLPKFYKSEIEPQESEI